ncbi:MAG: LptE family protein [Bacteroidetes bacterium]|nr:LptE family protein [Bacteroidota bacterium]MBP7398246.1 LptE family protein [Chitinophagales bacterium]MBK7109794.1 LptE family protein [Bacteroidota bacterium]MBK8487471.1 LptE family protein [Bacteroidota bacterium]MBK8682787.1 LptE family protein [Bacteroidota bacterium]
MKTRVLKAVVFIYSLVTLLSGCYTFQGNRIDPQIETVTINYFPNQSNFVATSLSQTFTETLKNKFASETRLYLKDNDGDWEYSGAITQYVSTPIAPTGNETTALNRLTIGVKVDFVNHKNEKENWSQTFSRFEDYPSTQSLSTVENDLIQRISLQLADDIYLKSASDW